MRKPKTISAARIEDALKTCLPSLKPTGTSMYEYELTTALGKLLIGCYPNALRGRAAVRPLRYQPQSVLGKVELRGSRRRCAGRPGHLLD